MDPKGLDILSQFPCLEELAQWFLLFFFFLSFHTGHKVEDIPNPQEKTDVFCLIKNAGNKPPDGSMRLEYLY